MALATWFWLFFALAVLGGIGALWGKWAWGWGVPLVLVLLMLLILALKAFGGPVTG